MEDEKIISIINILKGLRNLEAIQNLDGLYNDTNENAIGYKIQSGTEMNPENKKFPDRYMLLKHLSEDKFIVNDFGHISKYNWDKCLKYFKVNNGIITFYAEVIFELLEDINIWLDTKTQNLLLTQKCSR